MHFEYQNQQVNIVSICNKFNLGKPTSDLVQISGGLVHKMWKLETQDGIFAVKELNPEIMKRPNLVKEMNRSEMIANKFKISGVEAICAIEVGSEYVFKDSGKYYMVYNWVEGRVIKDPKEVTIELARKISSNLANIHKANLRVDGFETLNLSSVDIALWSNYRDQIHKTKYDWSTKCLDFIDQMENWIPISNLAVANTNQSTVISHGDIDMKNVIWDEKNNPQIIDWESVSPVIPLVELVKMALDWSGEINGKANREIFSEVFKAYREINSIDLDEIKNALYISLSDFLGWLEFNLNRALGIIECEKKDVEIANIEIPKTIDILNSRLKYLDEYVSWVQKI